MNSEAPVILKNSDAYPLVIAIFLVPALIAVGIYLISNHLKNGAKVEKAAKPTFYIIGVVFILFLLMTWIIASTLQNNF